MRGSEKYLFFYYLVVFNKHWIVFFRPSGFDRLMNLMNYICLKLSVPPIWIYTSSDAQLSPPLLGIFKSVCCVILSPYTRPGGAESG